MDYPENTTSGGTREGYCYLLGGGFGLKALHLLESFFSCFDVLGVDSSLNAHRIQLL